MLNRLAAGGAIVATRPHRRRAPRMPLVAGTVALLFSLVLSWLS